MTRTPPWDGLDDTVTGQGRGATGPTVDGLGLPDVGGVARAAQARELAAHGADVVVGDRADLLELS